MGAHIAGYLAALASAAPARPLFHCDGRTTSAGEAAARVGALATALAQRLGIRPGERVCLAALATDHSLEALLAVAAMGAIPAPLNWRWAAAEAAYAVDLVDAAAIVADAACAPLALELAARCPSVRAVVLLGSPAGYRGMTLPQPHLGSAIGERGSHSHSYSSCNADTAASAASSEPAQAQPPLVVFAESMMGECPVGGSGPLALAAAPGGAALLVFTSGTTGRPKGVVLSHDALHAQCMAKLLVCSYSTADVYLHAAPLFHIGGLNSALAMLAAGAAHVFLPRFDPAVALALIAQHRVTSFIAVPAMVADLVAAAQAARAPPLPCVTRMLLGGGGTPPTLLHALPALFPGATVQSAYGMTEAASSLTFHTVWTPGSSSSSGDHSPEPGGAAFGPAVHGSDDAAAAGVYVGSPPPGIELAVLQLGSSSSQAAAPGSSNSGQIVQEGQGEVVTRGAHVLLGYWEDEAATAAVMLPGGWMRTGDLGYLCHGRLWLLGRAKDMIKSGGENVHAWEVERALASHPGVAAAAVVGATDWRLGEAVAAAVVLRPGWAWAGAACQVLLRRHGLQEAQQQQAVAALADAASALGSARSAQQSPDEDLPGALLVEAPGSRPESALSARSLGSSPLLPEPTRQSQDLDVPQRAAQAVAAGLDRWAARAERSGVGDASKRVDGRALQEHCRAAGLAGFKLPRVFLLCAPGAAAAQVAAVATGRGGLHPLPLTSTGKVAKHLLRQLVDREMATAAGSPRSRL